MAPSGNGPVVPGQPQPDMADMIKQMQNQGAGNPGGQAAPGTPANPANPQAGQDDGPAGSLLPADHRTHVLKTEEGKRLAKRGRQMLAQSGLDYFIPNPFGGFKTDEADEGACPYIAVDRKTYQTYRQMMSSDYALSYARRAQDQSQTAIDKYEQDLAKARDQVVDQIADEFEKSTQDLLAKVNPAVLAPLQVVVGTSQFKLNDLTFRSPHGRSGMTRAEALEHDRNILEAFFSDNLPDQLVDKDIAELQGKLHPVPIGQAGQPAPQLPLQQKQENDAINKQIAEKKAAYQKAKDAYHYTYLGFESPDPANQGQNIDYSGTVKDLKEDLSGETPSATNPGGIIANLDAQLRNIMEQVHPDLVDRPAGVLRPEPISAGAALHMVSDARTTAKKLANDEIILAESRLATATAVAEATTKAVTDQEETVKTAQSTADDSSKKLADAQKHHADLQQQEQKLRDDYAAMEDKKNAGQTRAPTLKVELDAKTAEVQRLTQEYTGLFPQVEELSDEQDDGQAVDPAVEARRVAAKEAMDNADKERASLQHEFDDLKAFLPSANSQLQALQRRIDDLGKPIADANAGIAPLEAKSVQDGIALETAKQELGNKQHAKQKAANDKRLREMELEQQKAMLAAIDTMATHYEGAIKDHNDSAVSATHTIANIKDKDGNDLSVEEVQSGLSDGTYKAAESGNLGEVLLILNRDDKSKTAKVSLKSSNLNWRKAFSDIHKLRKQGGEFVLSGELERVFRKVSFALDLLRAAGGNNQIAANGFNKEAIMMINLIAAMKGYDNVDIPLPPGIPDSQMQDYNLTMEMIKAEQTEKAKKFEQDKQQALQRQVQQQSRHEVRATKEARATRDLAKKTQEIADKLTPAAESSQAEVAACQEKLEQARVEADAVCVTLGVGPVAPVAVAGAQPTTEAITVAKHAEYRQVVESQAATAQQKQTITKAVTAQADLTTAQQKAATLAAQSQSVTLAARNAGIARDGATHASIKIGRLQSELAAPGNLAGVVGGPSRERRREIKAELQELSATINRAHAEVRAQHSAAQGVQASAAGIVPSVASDNPSDQAKLEQARVAADAARQNVEALSVQLTGAGYTDYHKLVAPHVITARDTAVVAGGSQQQIQDAISAVYNQHQFDPTVNYCDDLSEFKQARQQSLEAQTRYAKLAIEQAAAEKHNITGIAEALLKAREAKDAAEQNFTAPRQTYSTALGGVDTAEQALAGVYTDLQATYVALSAQEVQLVDAQNALNEDIDEVIADDKANGRPARDRETIAATLLHQNKAVVDTQTQIDVIKDEIRQYYIQPAAGANPAQSGLIDAARKNVTDAKVEVDRTQGEFNQAQANAMPEVAEYSHQLQLQVHQLHKTVKSLNAAKIAAEERQASAQASVDGLRPRIDDLQAQYQTAVTTDNKDEQKKILAELNPLLEERADAQRQHDEAQAQVTQADADLAEVEAYAKKLMPELKAHAQDQALKDIADARVAAATARVGSLEAEIAQLRARSAQLEINIQAVDNPGPIRGQINEINRIVVSLDVKKAEAEKERDKEIAKRDSLQEVIDLAGGMDISGHVPPALVAGAPVAALQPVPSNFFDAPQLLVQASNLANQKAKSDATVAADAARTENFAAIKGSQEARVEAEKDVATKYAAMRAQSAINPDMQSNPALQAAHKEWTDAKAEFERLSEQEASISQNLVKAREVRSNVERVIADDAANIAARATDYENALQVHADFGDRVAALTTELQVLLARAQQPTVPNPALDAQIAEKEQEIAAARRAQQVADEKKTSAKTRLAAEFSNAEDATAVTTQIDGSRAARNDARIALQGAGENIDERALKNLSKETSLTPEQREMRLLAARVRNEDYAAMLAPTVQVYNATSNQAGCLDVTTAAATAVNEHAVASAAHLRVVPKASRFGSRHDKNAESANLAALHSSMVAHHHGPALVVMPVRGEGESQDSYDAKVARAYINAGHPVPMTQARYEAARVIDNTLPNPSPAGGPAMVFMQPAMRPLIPRKDDVVSEAAQAANEHEFDAEKQQQIDEAAGKVVSLRVPEVGEHGENCAAAHVDPYSKPKVKPAPGGGGMGMHGDGIPEDIKAQQARQASAAAAAAAQRPKPQIRPSI